MATATYVCSKAGPRLSRTEGFPCTMIDNSPKMPLRGGIRYDRGRGRGERKVRQKRGRRGKEKGRVNTEEERKGQKERKGFILKHQPGSIYDIPGNIVGELNCVQRP